MKIAVFPGQGAQSIGMGQDYFNKYQIAKELYLAAEEVSDIDLKKIIFEGPSEELKNTKIAQIAIMLTSIIGLKVLEEVKEQNLADMVDFVAGHSLGEYTALVAAGALDFSSAVNLLKVRGRAMEEAGITNPGGMIALIGVSDINVINEIAAKAQEASQEVCAVANNNAPGQVILSGTQKALTAATNIAKEEYKVRIVKPLEVSGAFHSPLMEPAQKALEQALAKVNFDKLNIPLISNVTAGVAEEAHIKELLSQQLVSPVKWCESMQFAVAEGVTNLVEIGPGKVLTGLMKRIDNSVVCVNIENEQDVTNY